MRRRRWSGSRRLRATAAAATVQLASGPVLSYAARGDRSGPAVVLLPGPTDSWLSYQGVLELLPLSIRGLAVSQRGHGDSDKPATGYRIEHFAADAVCFMDALGIDKAVLAGHSGSCMTARRIALDHPARVAGLVLEAAPTTLRASAALQEFVRTTISTLDDPIDTEFVRGFVADTSSAGLATGILDRLVREAAKVPAHVWREMFAALVDYDDVDELPRLDAPTLMLWGTGDSLVSRDMQLHLLDRIARSELIEYEAIGHTPRWEAPQRFAADLENFVDEQCS